MALQEWILIHQLKCLARRPLMSRQRGTRHLHDAGKGIEMVVDDAGDQLVIVVHHADRATSAEAERADVRDHARDEVGHEVVMVDKVFHYSSPSPSPSSSLP